MQYGNPHIFILTTSEELAHCLLQPHSHDNYLQKQTPE